MIVLITGAAGFIGSHLADALVAKGHEVHGVDNLETGRAENVNPQVRLTRADIRYKLPWHVDPDVVIHCAASYRNPEAWRMDEAVNVGGTITVAQYARNHDAKLVYFQTALPPTSSYAISKLAGEQYIYLSEVPSLIFRLANIYGPRNLSGPIPTFYKRLSKGQPCTVTETKRDTVFIDDLVRLVLKALDTDVTGKYDVCSGEHYPILDYYWAVADAMGRDDLPDVVPAGRDDVKSMSLDPVPAVIEFGWDPVVTLEEGVRQTVAWYDENGVDETYTHLRLGANV